MKSELKVNLNAYDIEDRVGLVLSFSIIAISLLLLGLYLITGFTVPEGKADSERVEIIRKTYFLKGLPVYAEFESERIVMTYLESENEVIEEFREYLGSSYTTEKLDGILLLHLSSPASNQTELEQVYDDVSAKVDAFNSLYS